MEQRRVTDAATQINEGFDAPWVWVAYEVYGWIARVRTQIGTPWDGPQEVHVYPDLSDEGVDETLSLAEASNGITSEILRNIPLADARKQLRRLRAAQQTEQAPDIRTMARPSTVEDWARFSRLYHDAVAGGYRQPVAHLAELTGLGRNTVSSRVRRARELGLLTRPNDSNMGELTQKALRILVDAGDIKILGKA